MSQIFTTAKLNADGLPQVYIAPSLYDLGSAPFVGYVTNPLTTNLDGGTFDLVNVGSGNISALKAETIGVRPGSLQTNVAFQDDAFFIQNKRVIFEGNGQVLTESGTRVLVREQDAGLSTRQYTFGNDNVVYQETAQRLNVNGSLSVPNILDISGSAGSNGLFLGKANGSLKWGAISPIVTNTFASGAVGNYGEFVYPASPGNYLGFSDTPQNASFCNAIKDLLLSQNVVQLSMADTTNNTYYNFNILVVDFTAGSQYQLYFEVLTALPIPLPFTVGDSVNAYYVITSSGGGVGPQGPTGATGATGPAGPTGASGYVGYGSFAYNNDLPPLASTDWGQNSSGLIIGNDPAQQTFLNSIFTLLDAGQVATVSVSQGSLSTTYYLTTYTQTSNYYTFPHPLAVSIPFVNNVATTFYVFTTGSQGPTGAEGPTGPAGPTGATGASGYSTALANKVGIIASPDVPTTALVYSDLPNPNPYVPLSDSLSVAPIAPSTGTGWRMTKPTTFLASTANLTVGVDYTVNVVGNTNWTAIGWTAPVVIGSTATYNGVAVTGTTGFVSLATVYGKNASWFPLNSLFQVSLPTEIAPATAVRKKDLNSVWALVRFNNDIAQQGYFSLTVESYAYQFNGNGSNNYTGRWAYSLPSWAVAGGSAVQFNAGTTLTTTMPRAVGGFTYLLYIEDKYPKMLPNIAGSFQVSNGMFPSQSQVANTSRDPYDIYPEYQHYPLNAMLYTANATQPPYQPTEGAVYADPADVEVATIYFKTTQGPNAPQSPQPAFDFQVLAMGYRGTNGAGTQAQNYTLTF